MPWCSSVAGGAGTGGPVRHCWTAAPFLPPPLVSVFLLSLSSLPSSLSAPPSPPIPRYRRPALVSPPMGLPLVGVGDLSCPPLTSWHVTGPAWLSCSLGMNTRMCSPLPFLRAPSPRVRHVVQAPGFVRIVGDVLISLAIQYRLSRLASADELAPMRHSEDDSVLSLHFFLILNVPPVGLR
jgi:hypothetical protein